VKKKRIADCTPTFKRSKSARTRRRIYDAAMQLFAEQGYVETTVADICAAADIARATFFLHFPHKSALILELSRAMAAEWLAQREQSDTVTPLETLRQMLEFIVCRNVSPRVAAPWLDEFHHEFGEDTAMLAAPGTMLGECTRLISAAQRTGGLVRDIPAREIALHFHRVTSAYVLVARGSSKLRASKAWRLFAHGAVSSAERNSTG
jgi:AcrR family transcriptional regulator